MLNVGIVGCGNIAWRWDNPNDTIFNTHAKSYCAHKGVRLVSCCDVDFKSASGLAKAYNVPRAYRDYRVMLKSERLDIVSVCAKTTAHYRLLNYILQHTNIKYILAEKPLTSSLAHTLAIANLARKKKVRININYLRRWDTALTGLSKLVASGDLGSYESGRVVYYGGFKRNALHFIDLLKWFGIKLVFERFLSEVISSSDDFSASAMFRTSQGKPLMLTGLNETNYPYLESDLFFKRGRARISDNSDVEIFRIRNSKHYRNFPELTRTKFISSTISTAMRHSIKDIIRACLAKEVDFSCLNNEIAMMELVAVMERNHGKK